MRRSLAIVVVLMLAGGPTWAAQQFVPTKTLLVKNPPSGARKVLWKVRATGSAATVVGDPTADGATLRIRLTPSGDQCVTMPASGWSAIGSVGFRYKDTALTNGPVKVAQVKKGASGTFIVKALLRNGGPSTITVAPGDPSTSYAVNLTLGLGDEYCGGTGTSPPTANNATTFKVSNDSMPAACVPSCRTTTTTSTSSSSTSSTSTSSTSTSTLPTRTCCQWGIDTGIGGPSSLCTWADDPGSCPEYAFPGEPGSVCDGASGECIAQPVHVGDCCEPNSGQDPCFGGPLLPLYCIIYFDLGEPHPGTFCAENGRCVASPGGAFLDALSLY